LLAASRLRENTNVKTIDKEYYCLDIDESGDIALSLKDGHYSPENLFQAAFQVLHEYPGFYLGTWTDHPHYKNIIYRAFAEDGRVTLHFHAPQNLDRFRKPHYGLLDRDRLGAALDDLMTLSNKLRALKQDGIAGS
jgi:hypothetical protein